MNNTFYLNKRLEEWQPEMSIRNLLDKKEYNFRMLVIKIDNKLIKKSDYDTAIIPLHADVQILHLMSGG
ncbi:MAG: sulfur carrier protein ThiS [Candidatus Cloacimonetes bacterium]|nr:sulfur carrier protein ThiS [Candidatus Cloacimonadota bacterium]